MWFLAASLLLLHCPQSSHGRMVDMTRVQDSQSFYWPGGIKFNLTSGWKGDFGEPVDGDVPDNILNPAWVSLNYFHQGEHTGTHCDAPAHFIDGGLFIDEIPLERLIGPGVTIDISQKVTEEGDDSSLSVDDILSWEEKNGQIPDGGVVIINTGHGKHYADRERYLGRPAGSEETDTSDLHYPGIGQAAAEWLVKNRNIVGVGLDTPSLDPGQSKIFESHQILLVKNIWGLENVGNTDKLPATGFTVYNMVYKIGKGTGAPSRVFAVIDGEGPKTEKLVGGATQHAPVVMALVAVIAARGLVL